MNFSSNPILSNIYSTPRPLFKPKHPGSTDPKRDPLFYSGSTFANYAQTQFSSCFRAVGEPGGAGPLGEEDQGAIVADLCETRGRARVETLF